MQIRGTPNEIGWIIDAIASGSNCDNCPIQRLCSTVCAIDERKGVPLSNCENITRKYLVMVEE